MNKSDRSRAVLNCTERSEAIGTPTFRERWCNLCTETSLVDKSADLPHNIGGKTMYTETSVVDISADLPLNIGGKSVYTYHCKKWEGRHQLCVEFYTVKEWNKHVLKIDN